MNVSYLKYIEVILLSLNDHVHEVRIFPKKTRRPFLMDKLNGIEGPRALM